MSDNSIPEKETLQTPANKEEIENEAKPREEYFTKSQVTEMIQKEIGKKTAKHSKELEAIKAELDAERKKSLPDPEKVKLEIEERDKKLSEAEAKLASLEARDRKRAALDAAKLNLPANITLNKLLDMMPLNEDEAIAGYIETFKEMFPERKGLGSDTVTGEKTKAKTIDEQLADINKEMFDPATTPQRKAQLGYELVSLNNKKQIYKK